MKRFLIIMVLGIFVLAGCDINLNTSSDNRDSEENSRKSDKAKATSKMKDFKIGQVIDADGVDVKVTKVEFVNDYDEYSAPENGKAIKVYLKFKNNNDEQVLVDSTDFSMKVDNENYQEWFGNEDVNDGFTHQLNKGNTASGYITYDVPDSEEYTLEMDATPNFESVKARWKIKKSDIKEGNKGNVSQTSTPVETEDTSDEDTSDSEDTESDDTPYTAEMYNDLVDEYNSLTDGEKMDHVDHDVLEIEYTQLEDRIEALYDKQIEEEDKALEEELQREEEEYEKEMDEIDKQYEEDMKELEEEESSESEDTSADDSEMPEKNAKETTE